MQHTANATVRVEGSPLALSTCCNTVRCWRQAHARGRPLASPGHPKLLPLAIHASRPASKLCTGSEQYHGCVCPDCTRPELSCQMQLWSRPSCAGRGGHQPSQALCFRRHLASSPSRPVPVDVPKRLPAEPPRHCHSGAGWPHTAQKTIKILLLGGDHDSRPASAAPSTLSLQTRISPPLTLQSSHTSGRHQCGSQAAMRTAAALRARAAPRRQCGRRPRRCAPGP